MKKNIKVIAFYLIAIIAMIAVTSWMVSNTGEEKLKYSELLEYFKTEQVSEFEIDNSNEIILTLNDEEKTQVSYKLRSLQMFLDDAGELIKEQHENGIITSYDYEEPVEVAWWVSYLPYLIVLIFVVVIYFVSINQAMGGKGGKINSFGR